MKIVVIIFSYNWIWNVKMYLYIYELYQLAKSHYKKQKQFREKFNKKIENKLFSAYL